jgi:hypothetical protein
MREHLQSAAAQGDADAELELQAVPALPRLAAHVWGWFIELARCRTYGGMGNPLPISYRDVVAWRDMTGVEPEPWELKAIFAIDVAWLDSLPKPETKPKK